MAIAMKEYNRDFNPSKCFIAFIVCENKNMIVSLGKIRLNLKLKYVAIIGLFYNSVLMIDYLILVLSPKLHNLFIKLLACVLYKVGKISNKENYMQEKR